MNKKIVIVLLHILGWLLFLIIPIVFSMKKSIRFEHLLENNHDFQNLLSWILLIGFSYFNHLYLVPNFYLDLRYFKYTLYSSICLIGIFLLPEITDLFWRPPLLDPNRPLHPPPSAILENSHFLLFYIVSILVSINYHTQIQLYETQKQRIQTELDNLKSQIQPHFLFNTLNSIYSLAIRKDEKTADTVVQLSEFLRYVIQNTQKNEVDLVKEIAYLSNYIDLQKSRLRNTVQVSFEIKGDPYKFKIAPLILFSFIENAFKYGVNPEEESTIEIRITITAISLSLHVYNKKVKIQNVSGAGIGLKNTKKRLHLIYPQSHDLKILETEREFKIELTIFFNS